MRSPKGKGKQTTEAPRGGALAFKHLKEEDAKRLLECADATDVEAKVLAKVQLSDPVVDLRSAAILDYYVSAVLWSRSRDHNPSQLSTVYSAVHEMLEGVKPPTSRTAVESVDAMRLLLADVGAEEASELSGGLELIGSVSEARELCTYISRTLLQHYSLFQFLFADSPSEDLLGCDLCIEVAPAPDDPPFPPPLPEGLPIELFHIISAPARPVSGKISREASMAIDSPGEAEKDEKKPPTPDVDVDAIFAELTPAEVTKVVEEVCREQLVGVEQEIAVKLREKENDMIARLNKIHKVASDS